MKQIFEALKNSPQGVTIVSEKGKILFWNSALEDITGINATEAKGQKIWALQEMLMPRPSIAQVKNNRIETWLSKNISEVAENLGFKKTEHVFVRRDGTSVNIEQNFHTFVHCSNIIYCAFISDIAERKRLEMIAATSIQILQHDFLSPLNVIKGFSEDDLVCEASHDDLITYLKMINDSAENMVRMSRASLLLSRIEQNSENVIKEAISLFNFLENLKNDFSHIEKSLSVNLKIGFDRQHLLTSGKADLLIEETLFRSLLFNLLRNAAEASQTEKKIISLFVSWKDEKVIFSVHNFGEIPDKIRSQLFTRYGTFGKKYGNGLGLYSAKLIATAHQGSIHFNSQNGETNFIVEIPAF